MNFRLVIAVTLDERLVIAIHLRGKGVRQCVY